MKWTLADAHGLDDVLIGLSEGREVYALEGRENDSYALSQAAKWQTGFHTLGAYRQTEPLKALFFPAREFIGRWGSKKTVGAGHAGDGDGAVEAPVPTPASQDSNPPVSEVRLDSEFQIAGMAGSYRSPNRRHGQFLQGRQIPERIVFGVKACDLSSLAVHDFVFLQGVARDPYYAEAREKTILVSADCSDQLDVCFCGAVGEQPFAESGYDINIAGTLAGYVIEDGSARGAKLLETVEHMLDKAGPLLLETLAEQRAERRREMNEHCRAHGLRPGADLRAAVEETFEYGFWADFAKDCVECGACNFICCTCHCFLLADGLDRDGTPARSKLWDACLFNGFARTAGGGTPRPFRAERLRNRFDKKFSFFPQVLGRYACDGCGRCTEACIARIDIRDVLGRAVDESRSLHAHTGDH